MVLLDNKLSKAVGFQMTKSLNRVVRVPFHFIFWSYQGIIYPELKKLKVELSKFHRQGKHIIMKTCFGAGRAVGLWDCDIQVLVLCSKPSS
jgi:hypothetical protein